MDFITMRDATFELLLVSQVVFIIMISVFIGSPHKLKRSFMLKMFLFLSKY